MEMMIAENQVMTHSRPFFHLPFYEVLNFDCLFNRQRAPGEAHPNEVVSFLQATEIVSASESVSSSKFSPASQFYILYNLPVFGRVQRSFLGCRIRCKGHMLLLTTDAQTGVCWVGGGLRSYLVHNYVVGFAAAQSTAGGVDLDDYFLDVAHATLVCGRGCLPSKVFHHLGKAVEEDGVLVPGTGNPGPKQKIKVVPSIVD